MCMPYNTKSALHEATQKALQLFVERKDLTPTLGHLSRQHTIDEVYPPY